MTTPHTPRPPWLGRAAAALLVLAVLTGAGVAAVTWLRHGDGTGARANARPSKLPPGPADSANVVDGPDGAKMRCPSGPVPSITLQEATFTPPLVDGRSFGKGTYTISLRGTVANDTTAAITITGVVMTLGGAYWQPKITVPSGLRATTGADISITGTYTSGGPAGASLHASLQWQWQAAVLQPCGKRGLIEDD